MFFPVLNFNGSQIETLVSATTQHGGNFLANHRILLHAKQPGILRTVAVKSSGSEAVVKYLPSLEREAGKP